MRARVAIVLALLVAACRGSDPEPADFVRPVVMPAMPLHLDNPQRERVTWPIWGSAFEPVDTTRARITLEPTGTGGVVFAQPGSPEQRHAFALVWDGAAWTLAETVGTTTLRRTTLDLPRVAHATVEIAEGGSAIRVVHGARAVGALSSILPPASGAIGIYVQLDPRAELAIDDLALSAPLDGPHLEPTLDALAAAHGRSFGTTSETGDWPPRHDLAFETMNAEQFGISGILDFYWATTRGEDPDYFFLPADLMVNYALVHGQTIHGYFLTWDEGLPAWLVERAKREPASIGPILDEHIATVMHRYRGRVQSWIVVNEAFAGPDEIDSDHAGYLPSPWLDALGPSYIERAFRAARANDPSAHLIYNEAAVEVENPKSDFMYEQLGKLLRAGVPIDAVGLQFHLDAAHPPDFASVERNLRRLAALGLDVVITELDVNLSHYPGTLAQRNAAQAAVFGKVIATCLAVPACKSITAFGFSDKHAWDELGPAACKHEGGDKLCSDPLLFTNDYAPKPAYDAVRRKLQP